MMPDHAERAWVRSLGNYSSLPRTAQDTLQFAAIFSDALPARAAMEVLRPSDDASGSDRPD